MLDRQQGRDPDRGPRRRFRLRQDHGLRRHGRLLLPARGEQGQQTPERGRRLEERGEPALQQRRPELHLRLPRARLLRLRQERRGPQKILQERGRRQPRIQRAGRGQRTGGRGDLQQRGHRPSRNRPSRQGQANPRNLALAPHSERSAGVAQQPLRRRQEKDFRLHLRLRRKGRRGPRPGHPRKAPVGHLPAFRQYAAQAAAPARTFPREEQAGGQRRHGRGGKGRTHPRRSTAALAELSQ